MNLLQETREAISDSGHAPTDVVFIGSRKSGHSCTWAEYEKLADFEYDDGFGSQKVATDLEIVFSDGATMWRHEYDGSECWMFSSPFAPPKDTRPITRLVGDDSPIGHNWWASLADLNPSAVLGDTQHDR
jgi:hypothetical protein